MQSPKWNRTFTLGSGVIVSRWRFEIHRHGFKRLHCRFQSSTLVIWKYSCQVIENRLWVCLFVCWVSPECGVFFPSSKGRNNNRIAGGRKGFPSKIHPPRPANCALFCLEVLFLFRSLSTDPRTLVCQRRTEDFHQVQIVKFVSFTGAFAGKYVVKSVKEVCETVHSTPKETCQHATQFDRPWKTACFWWVKETPKDTQVCDLGLCKFVGYFHVFSSSYLRRRRGPAVPKRDQQKMHRKSLYIFQTHEDARGPHMINFPHLLLR